MSLPPRRLFRGGERDLEESESDDEEDEDDEDDDEDDDDVEGDRRFFPRPILESRCDQSSQVLYICTRKVCGHGATITGFASMRRYDFDLDEKYSKCWSSYHE